jgi:uncharacterized protein with HEPN domain
MDFDEFAKDSKSVIPATKCIEVIGEATKHIPGSFKTKCQDIPGRDMAGMKDRLVHGSSQLIWRSSGIR